MSLETAKEEKFTESSGSSMDEKDLENGFVDVQNLIKSEQPKKLSEVDVLSQFLSNQFMDMKASPIENAIKVDDIVIQQEPDSTTKELVVEKQIDEILPIIAKEITRQETEQQQQQQQQQRKETEIEKPKPVEVSKPKTTDSSGCVYCAYVDEILTWKEPKLSGAIFGFLFLSLFSLASFSLLGIVGLILLSLMSLVGGYRLYSAILYRFKGQHDDMLTKFIGVKIELPKDHLQYLFNFIEVNGNDYVNKLKNIVLWENLTTSGIAYFVAFVIYSIGCAFNLTTLLMMIVIFAFTWPKVYKMYKVQIDSFVKTAHVQILDLINKVREKVPFLNKKKLN